MKPMWGKEGKVEEENLYSSRKNSLPSYPHNINTFSVFKNSDTHPFVPTHLCQLSTIQSPLSLPLYTP